METFSGVNTPFIVSKVVGGEVVTYTNVTGDSTTTLKAWVTKYAAMFKWFVFNTDQNFLFVSCYFLNALTSLMCIVNVLGRLSPKPFVRKLNHNPVVCCYNLSINIH